MKARVDVAGDGRAPPAAARGREATRTYYIAADEVLWDYLPAGENACEDHASAHAIPADDDDDGAGALNPLWWADDGDGAADFNGFEREDAAYLRAGEHRVGSTYLKAQWREYSDARFDTLRHGARSRGNGPSEHLGLQGPVLRGAVGDVLQLVVRNNLRFACGFHVHGGAELRAKGAYATDADAAAAAAAALAPG